MSEKLIIRNFGPIKEIELDLKKVNVLIGEQASGKSTVLKVLAVCRYFSYLYDFEEFINGLKAWGLSESLKEDSFISYKCSKYAFDFDNRKYPKKDIIDLNSDRFVSFGMIDSQNDEFLKLMNEYSPYKAEDYPVPPSFFQNYVAEIMDNPFYIPTERGLQSIFSLGKSSIQNISDSLFNQFANLDQISRLFKEETEIEPLGISYKNEDGKGYVKRKGDNQFYSMYNAASGYQSTIPVVLLLKYYSDIRKKAKHFFIEEPELNLFPKTQKKLIDFLISQVNKNGHSLFLTTHSPYILSSLNNLLYAFKIGNLDGSKYKNEVNQIIPEKNWINPDDVSVYYLENGAAKNLLDTEDGLIDVADLDGVSDIINKEFDKLLSIEVKNNSNHED